MKLQLPVVVTPTRVELGLRCYRRHALADILQRARYYSPSLEFGSVMHAGAAAWWLNAELDGDVARAKAHQAVASEWAKRFDANPQVTPGDHSLAMAEAMIQTYTMTAEMSGPFGLESGSWQLVSVEDRLEVPLVIGADRKAKLSFQTDRVVFNKANDHLVVVDTKTAARMDKRWDRQWETSLQMKLYKAAASRAYDMPPENIDVVVEGMLKDVPSNVRYIPCPDWSVDLLNEAVRQAQYIAERDFELLVGAVAKDKYALPAASRDSAKIIEDAVNKTSINYMSCFEYGVECPFRRLCTAEPDERVAILQAEYFEIPDADSGY
jgi:PD-(D/E)XK nuclease superfamily protein